MASRTVDCRVKIDKLVPGGQALGTLEDGKKVFLWGALPGEIVTKFICTKNKSHYCEGTAETVENVSSQRIEPRDACYLATSPWQIMDYSYELDQKSEILLEAFRQQGIAHDAEHMLSVQTDSREFGYRNKMEYSLYYDHDNQRIYPAFHQRGSHRKIPITESSLEMPAIWERAQEIIDELNRTGADARRYQSLLLRSNQTGEVSGGLYENHQPHPKFAELSDTILGTEYHYSPNGFFQINLPVYELALNVIREYITETEVLDLYAGVGTIGLSVAKEAKLTLVECDKAAYAEMERNVKTAGRPNITPVLAKSEEALEYIAPEQIVIVDPPRAGCQPEVIEKFLQVQPRKIIYLSCNPITQARDVAGLLSAYDILKCIPFNFFPRTPHLENLVILERKV